MLLKIIAILLIVQMTSKPLFGSLSISNSKHRIIVTLKGIDFKDTDYTSSSDCAIGKAIKRDFALRNIKINILLVGPDVVYLNDVNYTIIGRYDARQFDSDNPDITKNYSANHSIRNIVLIPN